MLYSVTIIFLNSNLQGLAGFEIPEYLYITSLCIFILTLVLIGGTYRLLYLKKKMYIFKNNIRQGLEEWITEMIINESATASTVPLKLNFTLKNSVARQILIDELVRNKSNFLGIVSDDIIKLYYQLGLHVESRIKLDSTETHLQCQGIHELGVMEQKDQLHKIYRLTNSKNKDVRIEAQTAILQWYGFKGLRFLDVATNPITEFQQLKLLEMLRQQKFNDLPKLSKWLISSNDTVVNFALKLAEHYKQSHVLSEAGQCLFHKSEEVRVQAVKTLVAIADASTANLLTTAYKGEHFTNKLNILAHLHKIGNDEQLEFLTGELNDGLEYLKLPVARALALCTTEGLKILEAKSHEEPLVYKEIYLHVKSEVLR